jgi:CheY-like chemotaxis protein
MDPLKIAIVEDEMINAETLRDMLEDSGYEVTGTYMRAKKALEAFEQDPPDFALLDIQLKGEETGIWLAQQIRDRFVFPFIFLTSFGDK